jgi:hypothetical protein
MQAHTSKPRNQWLKLSDGRMSQGRGASLREDWDDGSGGGGGAREKRRDEGFRRRR